jgi:16S rRNA (cytosine1402-N4)-methyltransferase
MLLNSRMSNEPLHTPVFAREIVELAERRSPRRVLDATFGRGGHTRAFLQRLPEALVWALDRDHEAIAFGEKEFTDELRSGRLHLRKGNFHDLPEDLDGWDLMLLDLGVSSPQLDQSSRGFSFYQDGPLDMRMDQAQELCAADVVNTWNEADLVELFRTLGEVHRPQRVVRAMIADRKVKPWARTGALAEMIARVEGWHRKGHHPATRYFLALRMYVNAELSGLQSSLPKLIERLSPGGWLMVITFHSLEDRIVKYAFKEALLGRPLFKKVIKPSMEETARNPRSRSAKLRVFVKDGGAHGTSAEESDPVF